MVTPDGLRSPQDLDKLSKNELLGNKIYLNKKDKSLYYVKNNSAKQTVNLSFKGSTQIILGEYQTLQITTQNMGDKKLIDTLRLCELTKSKIILYDRYEKDIMYPNKSKNVYSGAKTSIMTNERYKAYYQMMPRAKGGGPIPGCFTERSKWFRNYIDNFNNYFVYVNDDILSSHPIISTTNKNWRPLNRFIQKYPAIIIMNVVRNTFGLYVNTKTNTSVNAALGIGNCCSFDALTYMYWVACYNYLGKDKFFTDMSLIDTSNTEGWLTHNGKESGVYLIKNKQAQNFDVVSHLDIKSGVVINTTYPDGVLDIDDTASVNNSCVFKLYGLTNVPIARYTGRATNNYLRVFSSRTQAITDNAPSLVPGNVYKTTIANAKNAECFQVMYTDAGNVDYYRCLIGVSDKKLTVMNKPIPTEYSNNYHFRMQPDIITYFGDVENTYKNLSTEWVKVKHRNTVNIIKPNVGVGL